MDDPTNTLKRTAIDKRVWALLGLALAFVMNSGIILAGGKVPRAYWELPDQYLLGGALLISEFAVPVLAGICLAGLVGTSWKTRVLVAAPSAILFACVYVPASEMLSGRLGLYHRSTVARLAFVNSDDRLLDYYLLEEADENSPICTYRLCACDAGGPCQCSAAKQMVCNRPVSNEFDANERVLRITMPDGAPFSGELTLELVEP